MNRLNQAVALLALAGLPLTAALAQDVNAGKQVYAQCAACHAVTAANGVGPGLLGIVGENPVSRRGSVSARR